MCAVRAILLSAIVSAGCPAASIDSVEPLEQDRYVQAQTTGDILLTQSTNFRLFDEYIELAEAHPTTFVHSAASQRSMLDRPLITARGDSEVRAETLVGDIVIGQGVSSIDYHFNVKRPTDFTLLCNLAAEGPLDQYPAAGIRLTGPEGEYVIDETVFPGQALRLIDAGTLEPGVHRLQVISLSTVILGFLPDAVTADSSFSMLLAPAENCLADLNGDGVVRTEDLHLLLAAWGLDPDGPPDFDYNGDVDALDLNYLLGQWGDCPH